MRVAFGEEVEVRRLFAVCLAILLAGCSVNMTLFKGEPATDETRAYGLALLALRTQCNVVACVTTLKDLGIESGQALRQCTLAHMSETQSCKGGE